MKRYFLFGGCAFYAEGGANDFITSFDSVEDATNAAKELAARSGHAGVYQTEIEWWHVVNRFTMKKVAASDETPLGHDSGPWE
jgi:hypothetical protein